MSRPGWLGRLARGTVTRALSRPIAAEAAADLLDDYQRARDAKGAARAAIWLTRECLALTAVLLVASLQRSLRSTRVLRRDLHLVVRALGRRPASSMGVIAMLAIGLSAMAGTWGLSTALLFRPISDVNPDQLRRIGYVDRSGRTVLRFSEVELETIRNGLAATSTLSAVYLQPIVLKAQDDDTQTMAELLDGKHFGLLGIDVSAGRPLLELDAVLNAPPVAVISDTVWRDKFRRDPGVIGTTVRINGHAFTVVGVAAAGANGSFFGGGVDAWITTAHANAVLNRNWRTNPDDRFWTAFVRTESHAAARVDAALVRATHDLTQQLPDPWRERRLITTPATILAGGQREAAISLSLVLGALSMLILATAAANVGGVLLANALANRSRAAILLGNPVAMKCSNASMLPAERMSPIRAAAASADSGASRASCSMARHHRARSDARLRRATAKAWIVAAAARAPACRQMPAAP